MNKEIKDFLIYVDVGKNFSNRTTISYKSDLVLLKEFFVKNGIISWVQVSQGKILEYIASLKKTKLRSDNSSAQGSLF